MTDKPVEPGTVLGMLGGGQLGAMFVTAARRMGYDVAVWDPDADAPAHRVAAHSFVASFADTPTRERFAETVNAVTFEWENVPAELCEWLEQRRRVRPGSAVLHIIQDRVRQKQFLQSHGFSVPPFEVIDAAEQLHGAVERLGLPALCKRATAGYDGKGQWALHRPEDVNAVTEALHADAAPGTRWILESLIRFERELSVLVARGDGGTCVSYPVVENRHEQGILRLTLVPARISAGLAHQAGELARQAITVLGAVGLVCVELFQEPQGRLLINEIAPRPHNSGHYTLDACSVSQFEQQVRIVCDLPVGEARLLTPAAMVNLIGDDVQKVTTNEGYRSLLDTPGAVLHLYGKRVVRPRRKMGHVTFLADQYETAADRASRFLKTLS